MNDNESDRSASRDTLAGLRKDKGITVSELLGRLAVASQDWSLFGKEMMKGVSLEYMSTVSACGSPVCDGNYAQASLEYSSGKEALTRRCFLELNIICFALSTAHSGN